MNNRILQSSAVLMNFLVVFCVETAVFAAFPTLESSMEEYRFLQPPLWKQLALILVPVLFWAVREWSRKFWLFVCAHAGIAAAAVLLLGDNGSQRVVFGFFVIAYLLSSFRIRLTGNETEDGHENLTGKGMEETRMGVLLSAGVAAVTYFLCLYLKSETGSERIWNTTLLFAFLFFIDVYLQNLTRFVQFNRSSNSHIPVKGMLVRGGSLTLGFSLAAAAVLTAVTDNALMRGVTEFLKNAALVILRTIVGVITWFLGLFESEGEETVTQSAGMMSMPTEMGEATETPLWMEILSWIIQTALVIGVVVLIAVLLYQAVSALIRRFYQRKDVVREEEGRLIEIRESLKRERETKQKEKALPFLAGTPEERIRRSFVRTIRKTEKYRNPDGQTGKRKGRDLWQKAAQEKLLHGLTARQMMEAVGLTGQAEAVRTGWLGVELEPSVTEADREEAERLVSLYEKARYGSGVGAEDVKAAEAAAAKLARKR